MGSLRCCRGRSVVRLASGVLAGGVVSAWSGVRVGGTPARWFSVVSVATVSFDVATGLLLLAVAGEPLLPCIAAAEE